jgi:hypothetical protein
MRIAASRPARLVALSMLVALPALAALDMSEGLWETTITANGETRSLGTNCYTKADIAEMEQMLQGRSTPPDAACRYSGFTQAGNSVRYTMTCRYGDNVQESAVEAVYRGDSASGTIRTTNVTVTTASRRVGSCAQSSFER